MSFPILWFIFCVVLSEYVVPKQLTISLCAFMSSKIKTLIVSTFLLNSGYRRWCLRHVGVKYYSLWSSEVWRRISESCSKIWKVSNKIVCLIRKFAYWDTITSLFCFFYIITNWTNWKFDKQTFYFLGSALVFSFVDHNPWDTWYTKNVPL